MGQEAERVEKGKIHLGEALRDSTWNATGEQCEEQAKKDSLWYAAE